MPIKSSFLTAFDAALRRTNVSAAGSESDEETFRTLIRERLDSGEPAGRLEFEFPEREGNHGNHRVLRRGSGMGPRTKDEMAADFWVAMLASMRSSIPPAPDIPAFTTSDGHKLIPPTSAWTPFRYNYTQSALWWHTPRFVVLLAGRRSGKTHEAVSYLIEQAGSFTSHPDGLFYLAAPTREQAFLIFWNRLKRMLPKSWVAGISESRLSIRLKTGTTIQVIGLDRPERAEGRALDGVVFDEFQDADESAWYATLRPSLSTIDREGWAWLTGKPRAGRLHVKDLIEESSGGGEWGLFRWKSEEIIAASEIASAKRGLDPLTYRQEYEAEVVQLSSAVYYTYDPAVHPFRCAHLYDPSRELEVALDFNMAPGILEVCQHLPVDLPALLSSPIPLPASVPRLNGAGQAEWIDFWIDEITIDRDSTTEMIILEFVKRYGPGGTHAGERGHIGPLWFYGDATGGKGGTAQPKGRTDWNIIKDIVRPVFGDDACRFRIPKKNPEVVGRVNSLCARLRNTAGEVRMLIDPDRCKGLIEDCESVTWKMRTDGKREIQKKGDPKLTHRSDAVGYRSYHRFGWGWKSARVPLV